MKKEDYTFKVEVTDVYQDHITISATTEVQARIKLQEDIEACPIETRSNTFIESSTEITLQEDKYTFHNGHSSWQETHFEIVSAIAIEAEKSEPQGKVKEVIEARGTGGLYELAEDLTNRFEEANKGRDWDGEFFDVIGDFIGDSLFN
jgi:hypothetical protein